MKIKMNFKESFEVSSGELINVHVIAVTGIVWSSQSGDDMIFVENFRAVHGQVADVCLHRIVKMIYTY